MILGVAAVLVVYALGKLIESHDSASSPRAAPTHVRISTTMKQEPVRTQKFAGLTGVQASKFAASDLAALVGIGPHSSEGAAIATTGRKLSRTRCFHSGHWEPYWRVSFAGGSPVFESARTALVFCNRDRRVLEETAPIQH
jgi:hypothetical protein